MERNSTIYEEQLTKLATRINIVHSFMIIFSIMAVGGFFTWMNNFVKLPYSNFASKTQEIAFYTGMWSFWIGIALTFILAIVSISLFAYRDILKKKEYSVHSGLIRKPSIVLTTIAWTLPFALLAFIILDAIIQLLLFDLNLL